MQFSCRDTYFCAETVAKAVGEPIVNKSAVNEGPEGDNKSAESKQMKQKEGGMRWAGIMEEVENKPGKGDGRVLWTWDWS